MSTRIDTGYRFDKEAYTAALLRKRGNRSRMTTDAMARALIVSKATVGRMLIGASDPDIYLFVRVLNWIGVGPSAFIRRAHADGPPIVEQVCTLLLADTSLPPEVAQALTRMIRAAYGL